MIRLLVIAIASLAITLGSVYEIRADPIPDPLGSSDELVTVASTPTIESSGTCRDGVDNDGDGLTDYPADPGCSSGKDGSERGAAACDDGIDNDADGLSDFRADGLGDPDCTSPTDGDESSPTPPIGACNDGLDNDSDGLADFPADPGCSSATDDNERGLLACDDGTDNDGDGLSDYPDDPGCTSPADADEFGAVACDDSVDNDSDGLNNYPNDPGCTSPTDTNERQADGPACDDGTDNDGDGRIDFRADGLGDPDCTSPTDDDESPTPPQAITEQGKLIASDLPPADGLFGFAVAVSGEVAVVGDPFEQAAKGAAHIFVRSGDQWVHDQRLVASDGQSGDAFGSSVALQGDTAIIGAVDDDTAAGNDAGSAYVFTRSNGVWTQEKLTANDGVAGDHFGRSVALDGDRAVVGANDIEPFGGAGSGVGANAAYVFVRSSITGAWSQQGKLTASDAAPGEANGFGDSVAISGGTAVVGARLDDVGASVQAGSAYVFVYSETAGWLEQQKLIASDASDDGFADFGHAVAVSGDTALVGAPTYDTVYYFTRSAGSWTEQPQKLVPAEFPCEFGGSLSLSSDTAVIGNHCGGSAFVFVLSGGTWSQQQRLVPTDPGAQPSHAGWAVAASGDTVLLGTNRNRVVWAFVRADTTWTQQQTIRGPDGTGGDSLGHTVAVSGDTAILGAPGAGSSSANRPGAAYVYVRAGGVWELQQKLTAGAGAAFGSSVALSGDTAVIGAQGDENGGSAYVFVHSNGTWSHRGTLTNPDSNTINFGRSVSIDGDTAVVGAQGPGSGAAYVFTRSVGGPAEWTIQGTLLGHPTTFNHSFGTSVSVSGDTALVNSLADGGYVYVRSGTTWTFQQRLLASDSGAADWFGQSVALSGDTAVVGSPESDVSGVTNAGAAYVFTRSGTNWSEQQKLTASDAGPNSWLGFSVGISGDMIVAGAFGNDTARGADAGSAYAFARSGTTWAEYCKLVASDAAPFDQLGNSVGVSGDTVVAGAWRADRSSPETDSGAGYAFLLPPTLSRG